ncbi:MAG: DUF4382 domain-containing protein [Candidatus Methylomirabilales bacterium]
MRCRDGRGTREIERRVGSGLLCWGAVAVLLLGGAAACSAETQHASDHGQLEVRVKDHREAIADFRRLELDISQIGIQGGLRPQASAWVLFAPSRRNVDLTQLVDGKYAILLTEDTPAARYRWIRFDLEQVEGVLKNGRRPHMKVFDDPVAYPFRIVSGKRTVLTIDLTVVDVTDHPGKGYELHIRDASAQIVEATRS